MTKRIHITYDSDLIEAISSDFDLRKPNKEALRKLIFTLDGEYSPEVMQVLNLATGVGKTFLMAAFMEYLRVQGVGNVVIVTPGKVVQSKTVQNFTPGSGKYIKGAQVPPDIVTPQDYSAWVSRINGDPRLSYGTGIPILAFIFNIQQLIAPTEFDGETHGSTQEAERRKPRRFDENAGVLFDYLKELDDLVVIADESHLYSSSAVAFNSALKELDPAAIIGLTASVLPEDHVIFKYPLYQAIQDKYVKAPVLAFRKSGYGIDGCSEEQQLRDALKLREIKQAYYDSYASQNNKPQINAIAFVVCSDVDHATQIASLLRSPEFMGNDLSVLQVDSKHDDETTQLLLQTLDEPNSPVKVVVSVNKLKEGWDVKNIAVVVTLRAMASEVLTQQTMGRGLRLPFGQYTGKGQIDQLDIISHQSFRELLEAENILEQFGLEEAASSASPEQVKSLLRRAASDNDSESISSGFVYPNDSGKEMQDEIHDVDSETSGDINECDAVTGDGCAVSILAIGDQGFDEQERDITITTVQRNPAFIGVSYKFPVTIVSLVQPPIDLSEISDEDIEKAAKKVTSTGDVLYRKEIIASLEKKIRAVDVESAEVDSIHIDKEDARDALVRLVANMHLVPSNEETIRYIERYLIPKFVSNVSFADWTVKSLDSARAQLLSLVQDYIASVQRSIKEIPVIHPTEMKIESYPIGIGEKIYDPIDDRTQFVRGRLYSGWFKSLYESESFDSYSGEYKLAVLLNTSPHIVWWHRLHPRDSAFIYYSSKDRYYPDFVAFDDSGIFWIIEGKDKRGRDNEQVLAKRKAAESLVRRLVTIDEYVNQKWGYLVAFEDDIEKADSWDELKVLAQPVCNSMK